MAVDNPLLSQCYLTIFNLQTHSAGLPEPTKFQQNVAMRDWVIYESTNFHGLFQGLQQGQIQEFALGAVPFFPPLLLLFLPSPIHPFLPLPFPSLSFAFPPLSLGSRAPFKPARRLGSAVGSPGGSGAPLKTNLVHSKAVRKLLVAIILSEYSEVHVLQ